MLWDDNDYEKNINIIKNIYKNRFDIVRILMPFYYGNDSDVIGVYGNSFIFHQFIAQASSKLNELQCDDYLIIGDDLLLNPEINQWNVHEMMNIPDGAFYIDKAENVSDCEFNRPVLEASRFSPHYPGLDSSANRCVPSYDEALERLKSKELISRTTLSRWKPFYQEFKKPVFKDLYANYKIFKSRVWHFLKVIQYKLKPVKMPYPYIFGYSDILLVPKDKLISWSRYLEVFATWNMFVEMAIPTAIHLLPNAVVSHADNHTLKTGNVWYPQNPQHFNKISGIIDTLLQSSQSIDDLGRNYPKDYLYLHPVKLSRYAK